MIWEIRLSFPRGLWYTIASYGDCARRGTAPTAGKRPWVNVQGKRRTHTLEKITDRQKILIVDDSEMNRAILADML